MLLLDYKAVCAGLFLYRGKNGCCRAKRSKVIGKWRKQLSIVCSTSTNILKMEKLFLFIQVLRSGLYCAVSRLQGYLTVLHFPAIRGLLLLFLC